MGAADKNPAGLNAAVLDPESVKVLNAEVHRSVLNAAVLNAADWMNVEDRYFLTPLHYAAHYGHAGVAEALVSRRASLLSKTRKGSTPLDIADNRGKTSVMACLLTR